MNNYEKHALLVSYSYRGSRQGLVQARTLARCSRKSIGDVVNFKSNVIKLRILVV